jgi:hypothetical protein
MTSADHALHVEIPLSGALVRLGDETGLHDLEEHLHAAVVAARAGGLDGHEIGGGMVRLFFEGTDADRLYEEVTKALGSLGPLAGLTMIRRYGAPGSRERRTVWGDDGQSRTSSSKARRVSGTSPATPGDVVEIPTSKGRAFAQYTHHHSDIGQLIRVLPGTFPGRPDQAALRALVEGPTLYHAFFMLDRELEMGGVLPVGSFPIPGHARDFPVFRTGLPDRKTRRVEHWALWDGERQWGVGQLTTEQRRMPIRMVIPTADALAKRITDGWTPETDQRG